MLAESEVAAVARRIGDARRTGRLLDPLTDTGPVSLDDAYQIQRRLLADRLARGERRIGWKLGYTSTAMRTQLGVSAPNLGPLTDRMMLVDGDLIPADTVQPRVEPEIAVILDASLQPGANRETALAAIRTAWCALEIVDSVWRDYRFRLEDNTADGSSAAYVVLGPELPPGTALDEVPVRFGIDGSDLAVASGAAAMGHPADALAWLATELARQGEKLCADDLVITGGLTAAAALPPGSTAHATFGDRTVRTTRPNRRSP